MEFQIEQNYGELGEGYLYFKTLGDVSNIDLIKRMAIDTLREDYEKGNRLCKPTVFVREWEDGDIVKNGLQIKVKWR